MTLFWFPSNVVFSSARSTQRRGFEGEGVARDFAWRRKVQWRRKRAIPAVSEALTRAVNGTGLEELIARLSRAGGATAEIQPKNSGKPGDVDVIATYDLGIGTQEATVRVAYRIKQHDAHSDAYGIQQLLDRMEVETDLDRGCFVTTAEGVTEDARALADRNDILIVTTQDLIEWILRTGLRDL